jgi:hypothetical protein
VDVEHGVDIEAVVRTVDQDVEPAAGEGDQLPQRQVGEAVLVAKSDVGKYEGSNLQIPKIRAAKLNFVGLALLSF